LQEVRGLGPVLGLMIRAEVGDIGRFPTGGHLASYAGLVPRVEASAGRLRYGRITKRGSPWLRWALIEAAMHGPQRIGCGGSVGPTVGASAKGALKARVAYARQLCHEIHAVVGARVAWTSSPGRRLGSSPDRRVVESVNERRPGPN
jgi:transposase